MRPSLTLFAITLQIVCGVMFVSNTAFADIPPPPALPSKVPATWAAPAVPTGLPAVTLPSTPAPTTGGSSEQPDYNAAIGIISQIDHHIDQISKGKPPFIEVIQVQKWKTYMQNDAECRAKQAKADPKDPPDPLKCPKYEYTVPYSLESDSQQVARGIRRAWQRFEDRYYWRVMTQLNNPALFVANCTIGLGGGVNPAAPNIKINVPKEIVPQQIGGNLQYPDTDVSLRLDSYAPFPAVVKDDFCDGLNFEFLPFMYIPGFCFGIYGVRLFCTDSYPQPLWFNRDAANNRVASAISHSMTKYLAEYQTDLITELAPGKDGRVFFPLPWASHIPGAGAIIAPVANLSADPTPFISSAQEAVNKLGGTEGYSASAYFFQTTGIRFALLDTNLLPGRNAKLDYNPPGLWRLEEYKRWWPTTNLALQERLGYTTFFEAWQDFDTVVLPEASPFERALRTINYFAVGLDINCAIFTGCSIRPDLAIVPVAPYQLPFAGPRMKWAWTSVAEGYPIPRVRGDPLYDYTALVR